MLLEKRTSSWESDRHEVKLKLCHLKAVVTMDNSSLFSELQVLNEIMIVPLTGLLGERYESNRPTVGLSEWQLHLVVRLLGPLRIGSM